MPSVMNESIYRLIDWYHAMLSDGNVFNYKLTSSICVGIKRILQIRQWCILFGSF